MTDVE